MYCSSKHCMRDECFNPVQYKTYSTIKLLHSFINMNAVLFHSILFGKWIIVRLPANFHDNKSTLDWAAATHLRAPVPHVSTFDWWSKPGDVYKNFIYIASLIIKMRFEMAGNESVCRMFRSWFLAIEWKWGSAWFPLLKSAIDLLPLHSFAISLTIALT